MPSKGMTSDQSADSLVGMIRHLYRSRPKSELGGQLLIDFHDGRRALFAVEVQPRPVTDSLQELLFPLFRPDRMFCQVAVHLKEDNPLAVCLVKHVREPVPN